jgi:serine/threonine-protein kinase
MNDLVDQSPVQSGDVLAGRFRVERVLGIGGMGVVVAARHLQLDSVVAIKFLLPAILENEEAVRRFAREARAAVKIQNEHVARVTDVGALENGAPYMVMEYLEGSDLSALLRAQGRLSVEESVDFVLQASEAIAEAHSLGIIHRDLKPANLFLVRRSDGSRTVKVLDFGISKMNDMNGPAMTRTASMMGSPFHMSPEQLTDARDVDVRTDIWALGVILHELVSGQLPFPSSSLGQVCMAILQAPPTPLRRARPDVPPGLEAVVLRCLEKDRSLRFSSVVELAQALAEYAPPRARTSIERIAHVLSFSNTSSVASSVPQRPAMNSPRVETVAVSAPDEMPHPRIETVLVTASGVQAAWGHTTKQKKPQGRRHLVLVSSVAFVALLVTLLVAILGPSRSPRSTGAPSPSAAHVESLPSAAAPVVAGENEDRVGTGAENLAPAPILEGEPEPVAPSISQPTKRNVRPPTSSPHSQPMVRPKRPNMPGSGLD